MIGIADSCGAALSGSKPAAMLRKFRRFKCTGRKRVKFSRSILCPRQDYLVRRSGCMPNFLHASVRCLNDAHAPDCPIPAW